MSLNFPFTEAPEPGTCTLIAPGILWARMPLPIALDHINLYLLEDGEGWAIIDTGMKGQSTQQHWLQVFDKELSGKPVTKIIATHMHPDHVGQAGWLSEHWQAPFYMTFGEYFAARTFSSPVPQHDSWAMKKHLIGTGMPPEYYEKIRKGSMDFSSLVEPLPRSYQRLREGQFLKIGKHQWRIMIGEGHSPEHACLYCAELNILISGDQIIPDISSNVSVTSIEPDGNPLQSWLESLDRFRELPADTLVLPAHKLPFYGIQERINSLIQHHEKHMQLLLEACSTPRSAVELLPVLFRKNLDNSQMMMALGECLAHLRLMLERNWLSRTTDEDGVYHYQAVIRDEEGPDYYAALHE
ncbi:MAG: MBL fold metallo-hydrolase [Pseudomonadales bacterium]|nr:MBL fold metallo-hydrolase [Pseudomonadales bacterium]